METSASSPSMTLLLTVEVVLCSHHCKTMWNICKYIALGNKLYNEDVTQKVHFKNCIYHYIKICQDASTTIQRSLSTEM